MATPCAAVKWCEEEAWLSPFLLQVAIQQSCLGIATESQLRRFASEHLSPEPSVWKKGFVGCDLMTVGGMEERECGCEWDL